MSDAMATSDGWAFARDGVMNDAGRKVDTLTVDFWAKGMVRPACLIQQYQSPAKANRFRLLGEPRLVVGGVIQLPEVAKSLLDQVHKGIQSHFKAAPLWESWR